MSYLCGVPGCPHKGLEQSEAPTPLVNPEARLNSLKQALLSYCRMEDSMVDHPAWVPTEAIKKIVKQYCNK